MRWPQRSIAVGTVLMVAFPGVALAYIGPGAGITAIGTAIAFVGAILLTIVGFVWYPIKRLLAKLRNRRNHARGSDADQSS